MPFGLSPQLGEALIAQRLVRPSGIEAAVTGEIAAGSDAIANKSAVESMDKTREATAETRKQWRAKELTLKQAEFFERQYAELSTIIVDSRRAHSERMAKAAY